MYAWSDTQQVDPAQGQLQHSLVILNAAAGCMRKELAPLALNGYPEAYTEFRHLALMLVFQPGHVRSPVADKWATSQRQEVAGRLARTIRQATGVASKQI